MLAWKKEESMKRSCYLAFALIIISTSLFGAKPGTWTELEPVPHRGIGVEGMSVAVVGNKIIAALGFDAVDTDATRIYDIASNTWSAGAPAPGISSEGAGASHGGLFYTAGGRFIGARNDLWSYSPPSDTWTVLAPMLQGRAGFPLAVAGNALYAFGGRLNTGGPCNGAPIARVERYDIDTDTWSPVAPMPRPLSDRAAATIGGKIYLFGGCETQLSIVNSVDVYDPVTDTWSTEPTDMPTARAAMYSVDSKGNAIYVIGGWDGIVPGLQTNEAYHVAHDEWTVEVPMPTGRAEAGAVGHGGRIFVVGGAKPGFGASVANNEAYKP